MSVSGALELRVLEVCGIPVRWLPTIRAPWIAAIAVVRLSPTGKPLALRCQELLYRRAQSTKTGLPVVIMAIRVVFFLDIIWHTGLITKSCVPCCSARMLPPTRSRADSGWRVEGSRPYKQTGRRLCPDLIEGPAASLAGTSALSHSTWRPTRMDRHPVRNPVRQPAQSPPYVGAACVMRDHVTAAR